MRAWALAGVFAIACGPQIAGDDQASTGGAGSPDEAGATSDTLSGSGPPPSLTDAGATTTQPDSSSGATFGDGGDDDDDDGSFVIGGDICAPPQDGKSFHCGEFECDVFAQDCFEDLKCMPWANDGGDTWNDTRCSPVSATPTQLGDACHVENNVVSGVDDCDFGLMCLHVDPATGEGVCVAMCTGTADMPACQDDTQCMIRYDGVIALCLETCDPLAETCPMGDCIPIDAGVAGPVGFGCFVDTADALPGEACDRPGGCGPAATCNFGTPECPDAIGCCASYCDLDGTDPDAPCLPGQVCTPIFDLEDADPEIAAVGQCMAP